MKQRVINKSIVLLVFFMNYLFGGWISLRAPSNDADICEWSFISPDTGFIAQYYSLWKTTDGGITYQSVGPYGDTGYYVYPIQVVDINTCYFLYYNFCDTAFIWKTPDGGTSWECMLKLDGMTQSYPFSIFFLNPNYGYIVVPKDTNILKTTDGGRTWFSVPILGNFVSSIYFLDTLTGYALESYVRIWKTTNGGANWQLIYTFDRSSNIESWKMLFPVDQQTGYILASKEPGDHVYGIILKTTDGGYSWEEIFSAGRESEITGISFVSNDTGYLSTLKEGENSDICKLFKTTNGRNFFRLSIPLRRGDYISSIYFINGTQTGYVFSEDGNGDLWILKTVDGGGESLGFWRQLTLIPEKPKKGVLLSYDQESYSLFLLQKGKTPKLWCYEIASDSWQTKKPIPVEIKEGGITYDGEGLTVLKLKSKEFWHYNIENDSWLKLPDLPGETLARKGGCITSDGESLLFILKGGKINEFRVFNKENNQWLRKPNIPGTPVTKGANIACDGEYVYALKGGKTNEFWSYSIKGDSWHRMPDIPGYWIKDGSCLAANLYCEEKKLIFALKGSSQECWYFDTELGYWKLIPGIPGKKKIKAGAQLAVDENSICYSIKAKKLQEIWYTDELVYSSTVGFKPEKVLENIQTNQVKPIMTKSDIQISNPTNQIMLNLLPPDWISISLYDIMGKRIETINNQTPSIEFGEKLSQGIYFLRIKMKSSITSRKLIVTR